jgi:hypothetical protein
MVKYETLIQKPEFWSLNSKKLLVSPLVYGGASLRGKGLNQGVRAILHGGEFIVPAKLVHLIPEKIKKEVKKINKEHEED